MNPEKALIILDDPHVSWQVFSGSGLTVHARGHAFRGNDYLTGTRLAESIGKSLSATLAEDDRHRAIRQVLLELNGSWAFAAETDAGEVIAAADIIRSIPLFFATNGNRLLVAWSCYALLAHLDRVQIDAGTAAQFFLSGLAPGNSTFYENVRQLQMGEYLYYTPGSQPAVLKYFSYLPDEEPHAGEAEMQQLLIDALDESFSRYCKAFRDETIAVSLSGGLDSRILAAMLKRHGHKDVICFTYGRSNTRDARFSKDAAEAIGYPWQLCEYDVSTWQRWRSRQEEYWDYACRGALLPVYQECPAIKAIAESRPGSRLIYMPGHTALDAYNTPWGIVHKASDATFDDLIETLLTTKFRLWADYPNRMRRAAEKELHREFAAAGIDGFFDIYSHHNRWCVENRESKYIVNTARAYEFFDQDWALPLWDIPIARLSLAMPVRLRWRKRLLANTLLDRICTGSLAGLADVPRTCYYGEPTNARVPEDDFNVTSKVRVKEEAGLMRSVVRRLTPLLRFKHGKQPARQMAALMWEYCFCGSSPPDAVRVAEVMKQFGAAYLAPEMQNELHAQGNVWLQGANLEQVLAPVILAREYQRCKSY